MGCWFKSQKTISVFASLLLHAVCVLFFFLAATPALKKKVQSLQVNVQWSRSLMSECPLLEPFGNQSVLSGKQKPKENLRAPLKKLAGQSKIDNLAGEEISDFGDGTSTSGPLKRGLGCGPRLLVGQDVGVPYPKKARLLGVQGSVRLLLFISKQGKVEQVDVLSGPGFGLTAAAEGLAKKLMFAPAQNEDGEAMASKIEHEVVFRLKSNAKSVEEG